MSLPVSWIVSPTATHPGRSGTKTPDPVSLFSMTTAYRIYLISSLLPINGYRDSPAKHTKAREKQRLVLDSGISFASIPVFTGATSFLVLRILSLHLIRVIGGIRGALLLLSISVYSCPFVVSFLGLDLVGPEKLPHSYGVDCD